MTQRFQRILGWIAVGVSTLIATLWAYWGIIENFHEGWYYVSLWMNLGMMMAQYLLPMFVFVAAALLAIRWPRLGGGLHIVGALCVAWFFRGSKAVYPLIVAPLVLLGVSYWFGRPQPRRRAIAAVVILPLLAVLVCGVEPAVRISSRLDDGNLSARRVAGNGVDLIWAPEGPGWPRDGVSWEEARRRCQYLNADGTSLADTPQNIWRLPTIEEAVRSMQRHGHNSGGTWNAEHRRASYERTPDKESPLWNVHSKVIYWWTATEVNNLQAFIIVYDGKVWPRPKRVQWGYLGFRAVRNAGR
jgi:hypothetical protein